MVVGKVIELHCMKFGFITFVYALSEAISKWKTFIQILH